MGLGVMADRTIDKPSIENTWRALAGRLATFAGSATALVALWHHVPPHVAALRGAGAWLVVLVVSRVGLRALCRAIDLDLAHASPEQEDAP